MKSSMRHKIETAQAGEIREVARPMEKQYRHGPAAGERDLNEQKYRLLFDSIDEGFCIIQVIFDANENPVDYRFLEVNPAFVRQTGLREATGRRMRELAP